VLVFALYNTHHDPDAVNWLDEVERDVVEAEDKGD
jgi:hypothetical protein